MLTRKNPVDWKLDPDSNFINKILDELVVPVEKHYKKLTNKIGLITFDEDYDPMAKYKYDSKLSMTENYERSKEFDKKVELYYQLNDEQSSYNSILEEAQPIYNGITTEEKREELFKNIRNKVKNVASI